MKSNLLSTKIEIAEASNILNSLYKLKGELVRLDGEVDFNFFVKTKTKKYILKITRINTDKNYLKYQNDLLQHLTKNKILLTPKPNPDINGQYISEILDSQNNKRLVRLISWIEGRLFSSVNPKNESLLFSLGKKAGLISKELISFSHQFAHKKLEWDLAQAEWVKKYVHLFNEQQQEIVNHFIELFEKHKEIYKNLRKSIVHNDVNDNNIIVNDNLQNPEVISIIDYGDAIYTQTINDLAICIAYGVMDKPDPLSASTKIIKGYNQSYSLTQDELKLLYTLVGIRLVISVTKSAINKEKEPENRYLQISEKPAWDLLNKWKGLNEEFVTYHFREACGFQSFPKEEQFSRLLEKSKFSLNELFPSLSFNSVCRIDMSVSSSFLGTKEEYNNNDILSLKIKRVELEHPNSLIAGGYLETRPIYITDAYKKEGNNGHEYRCNHLGVDFWVDANTPIHSILDGRVFSVHNNNNDKDYGPTVIIMHNLDDLTFYTLYGHLSKKSLGILKVGQNINKGELIGYIGNSMENGNWAPHLHFQIIMNMLNYVNDFPGVAYTNEIDTWKSICPDPNLLFKEPVLENKNRNDIVSILSERKKYLGKSLSISYNKPLNIVRGEGQYLIDIYGRKYLDTVNNVAHVGHENFNVVKAAQDQIALLNTNTRYLHKNINEFAKELLSTFPKELSVVYFVNSGSEANELALRMAKTYTNQKDIIAVEVGYHGNTSGCVEVSSYKFDGKGGKGVPDFTHIVPLPDSYRGIYSGDDCGKKYANHIFEQIENIKLKGRNVAGFICESIISCGGQIELPKQYLNFAYKYVRDAKGVCIADEVQVGCGRVGSKFWGFELHNVIPDIVTIGKPIGNGHPLAAVVCTNKIAESFNNGMEYFNTFGGNPVSCAIGRKVLEILKEGNLQENALKVGNYLKEKLNNLQTFFPIIGNVRGQGLFLGFELVDKNKTPQGEKANYLANRMRELGILMSTDGKDNNVLKIKPPLIFTIENVDELIFRLTQVFKEDFMRLNDE